MADTLTVNYAWTLPEVGASADTWGTKWNANFNTAVTGVDAVIKSVSNFANAAAAKANNLSDLTSAASARGNLGLAIGTNVQAYDALLASIAGLSFGANTYIYGTGADTAAVGTLTTFVRTLLDDPDAAAFRATLGLGALAILSVVNGSNWSGQDLAIADGGTGASDSAGARTSLGLAIGTNVQAYSAVLAALAGVTLAADTLYFGNGPGAVGSTSFTAAGRALLDDADAAAQRTTLGLGSMATVASPAPVANGGTGANDAATARTNLGLGAAATQALSAFLQPSNNLSDVASPATARSNLGLGAVENKSSSAIRGELTKANVDTALGKTAARVSSGAAASSGLISWGTAAPGALAEGEIYLRHA